MVYLNDWSESGRDGLIFDFEISEGALEGAEILVASYTLEWYEGYAYVLFRRDGKLYEVHGSHCSCYGLEGQWEPEWTVKEVIIHRLDNGTWGEEGRIADTIREVLKNEN